MYLILINFTYIIDQSFIYKHKSYILKLIEYLIKDDSRFEVFSPKDKHDLKIIELATFI